MISKFQTSSRITKGKMGCSEILFSTDEWVRGPGVTRFTPVLISQTSQLALESNKHTNCFIFILHKTVDKLDWVGEGKTEIVENFLRSSILAGISDDSLEAAARVITNTSKGGKFGDEQ